MAKLQNLIQLSCLWNTTWAGWIIPLSPPFHCPFSTIVLGRVTWAGGVTGIGRWSSSDGSNSCSTNCVVVSRSSILKDVDDAANPDGRGMSSQDETPATIATKNTESTATATLI